MQILKNSLCSFFLVIAAMFAATISANEKINDPYALVISGGVSLGVYEAGLNWVIVETLKSENEKSNGNYFALDAVTGTSAGAINSILSALRYCEISKHANHKNNLLYKTWNIGITDLLPTDQSKYDKLRLSTIGESGESGESNEILSDSLFARGAFKDTIASIKMQTQLPIYKAGCKVKLAVIVTSSQSQKVTGNIAVQRFVVPLQLVTEKLPNNTNARAKFINYYDFSNVKNPNNHYIFLPETDGEINIDVVIRAALASSAFPLAFGRVKLKHCKPWIYTQNEAQSPECPDDYKLSSGHFIDGGVFDNIPLRSAVDLVEGQNGIAAHSKYIYIDPDNIAGAKTETKAKAIERATTNNKHIKLQSYNTDQVHYTGGELVKFNAQLLPNLTTSDFKYRIKVHQESDSPATVEKLQANSKQINLQSGKPTLISWQFEIDRNREAGKYNFEIEIFRESENEESVLWRVDNIPGFTVQDTGAMALNNQIGSLLPAITTLRKQELSWTLGEKFIDEGENGNNSTRSLLPSTRSKSITGYFLANFGAFLDPTFRTYDYAVGIFDGLRYVTQLLCNEKPVDANNIAHRCSNGEATLFKELAVRLLNLNNAHSECAKSGDDRTPNICLTVKLFADNYENGKYEFDWKVDTTKSENSYPTATYLINEILKKYPNIEFENFLTELRASIVEYSTAHESPPESQYAALLTDIMNRQSPDWKNDILLAATSRLYELEKQTEGEAQSPLAALWVMTPETNVGGKKIKNYSPYRPKYPWWNKALPYFIGVDGAQTGSVLTWSTQRLPIGFITDKSGVNVNFFSTVNFQFSAVDDNRKGSSSLGFTMNYELSDNFLFSSAGANLFTSYDKYGFTSDLAKTHPGAELYWGFLGDKFRISLGNRNLNNIRGNWMLRVGISEFHRFLPLMRNRFGF